MAIILLCVVFIWLLRFRAVKLHKAKQGSARHFIQYPLQNHSGIKTTSLKSIVPGKFPMPCTRQGASGFPIIWRELL